MKRLNKKALPPTVFRHVANPDRLHLKNMSKNFICKIGENTKITIRKENKNDFKTIKQINDEALCQPQEGMVVDKLRELDTNALSLVAEINGKLVGHIF